MAIALATAVLVWLATGFLVAWVTGQLAVAQWLHQGFLVLDQALNWLSTPFHRGAWADETLSARSWRAYRDGRLWGRLTRAPIDLLFFWQGPGHCERAYASERARLHSPPEQR